MKPCPISPFRALASAVLLFVLTSCQTVVEKVSPDPGDPQAPESFRRGGNVEAVSAESSDSWWTVFNDSQLNSLMEQVPEANPDVAAAQARVDQAMAALGITSAAKVPSITGDASFTSRRDSLNNLLFPIDDFEYDQYLLGVNSSWEIDLWGRLKGATKRDRLSAEAAADRYEAAVLSIRSDVARNYFNLLFLEREIGILEDTVRVREDAYDLRNKQVERGAATRLVATSARTELETARADLEGLLRTKGNLEHAIAVLVGQAPAELTVDTPQSQGAPPKVPAGVPSELLARRPDLQAAWKDLEGASLNVGVAFAQFLPAIRLNGSGGISSLNSSSLFASDSSFFNIGPEVDVPIFQGGRRKSTVAQARARQEEVLAEWRSTLLTAVREVDDSLHDIQTLDRQIAASQRAADSAGETLRLAQLQYERGLVSFLDVVEAERTRLQADRTVNALRGERMGATVQLIQALGGSW